MFAIFCIFNISLAWQLPMDALGKQRIITAVRDDEVLQGVFAGLLVGMLICVNTSLGSVCPKEFGRGLCVWQFTYLSYIIYLAAKLGPC